MDINTKNKLANLDCDLQSLEDSVMALAKNHQGNPMEILAVLRILESLHQQLREGLFQEALPDNRQALYNLLKDIEAKGGWPYIPRPRLRCILENWFSEEL
ncbi:MAG: hypothetical protein WBA93_11320 [Microcoleaceae cyanobacterium]